MALNFPPNPNIGDTHTIGTKTYSWSGSAWLVSSSNVTANQINVTGGANSVSTITGSLIVNGGIGVGGDLWLGGNLYLNGTSIITTATLQSNVFGGTDIRITRIGAGGYQYLRFDNTSTLQSVTSRGSTTSNRINISNQTESVSTTTGAVVVAGGLGVGKRINCESLRVADAVFDSSDILVNTTASTVIDSYLLSDFRSAKYFIQIASGGGLTHLATTATFQSVELILVADNTGAVYATEYGLVVTGGASGAPSLGTFQAELSLIDNRVRLYFTAGSETNKTIKVLRTGMAS